MHIYIYVHTWLCAVHSPHGIPRTHGPGTLSYCVEGILLHREGRGGRTKLRNYTFTYTHTDIHTYGHVYLHITDGCAYVCKYVLTFVCMHGCMFACVYVSICACVYACMSRMSVCRAPARSRCISNVAVLMSVKLQGSFS